MKTCTLPLVVIATLWCSSPAPAATSNLKLFFKNECNVEFTYRFYDLNKQVSGKGTIPVKNKNPLETGLIPTGWYTVEIYSGDKLVYRETLNLMCDRTFVVFFAKKRYCVDEENRLRSREENRLRPQDEENRLRNR